jgi:hypothetical protein
MRKRGVLQLALQLNFYGTLIRISPHTLTVQQKFCLIYIYASMVNKFLRSQIMQTKVFFNVTIS